MSMYWFEHEKSGDYVAVKAHSADEAWNSLHEFAVKVWQQDHLENVEQTKGAFDLERVTLSEQSGVIVSIVSGVIDIK